MTRGQFRLGARATINVALLDSWLFTPLRSIFEFQKGLTAHPLLHHDHRDQGGDHQKVISEEWRMLLSCKTALVIVNSATSPGLSGRRHPIVKATIKEDYDDDVVMGCGSADFG